MSESIEFGISAGLLWGAKQQARRAEELGYDYLLTGEHLMFYTPIGNTMVSLAAAAGATERIKLMSGIALVPLYPAALLAKQAAVLDVVSDGRFSLGIGVELASVRSLWFAGFLSACSAKVATVLRSEHAQILG